MVYSQTYHYQQLPWKIGIKFPQISQSHQIPIGICIEVFTYTTSIKLQTMCTWPTWRNTTWNGASQLCLRQEETIPHYLVTPTIISMQETWISCLKVSVASHTLLLITHSLMLTHYHRNGLSWNFTSLLEAKILTRPNGFTLLLLEMRMEMVFIKSMWQWSLITLRTSILSHGMKILKRLLPQLLLMIIPLKKFKVITIELLLLSQMVRVLLKLLCKWEKA